LAVNLLGARCLAHFGIAAETQAGTMRTNEFGFASSGDDRE
jgi:hypothetical protein